MNSIGNSHISRRRMLLSVPALIMAPRTLLQTSNPRIRVTGINHVTLSVSDVKRSVDFYQGLFGMPVLSRQGPTVTNLQIGNGPQFLGINAAGSNASNINHLCLGVEDFNVDRIVGILRQHGFAQSDATGPMKVRVRMREGTTEVHFGDPDGIVIQLQDARYCGGTGPLGNVCARPEPAPKKGLLAVRDWNHCTNSVSDPARSHKFYLELFDFQIQAYQGPASPVLGIGNGVQFVMFAGPRNPTGINHLCMSMDNFNPDAVIKALESYGIKPRSNTQGTVGPLVHYVNRRMENRGGAKEGTPELYFTDPDGLPIQLQDTKYCGGGGVLGNICV